MSKKPTDHHQALSKAKIQLMARPDSAFFTTVCFSLKHVWDDRIPTACTNGKEIRFSPKFFMSLSVEEQIFLLIHESMHVAYLHMVRLGARDRKKWNIAADYVINHQLIERGFKMPAMGLHDPQYAGMSTEQVYDKLPDDPPQQCDMDIDHDSAGAGEDSNDQGQTQDQLAADIQDILVRATIQSKMCGDKPGTVPGDIQIFIDRLLKPTLPWNRILQKYLQSFTKNDYSFKKPNRRFFPQWHLPSLWGEKLIDLRIYVDASGSVSDHDFLVFVTEVSSILRMMKPDKITLISFDTSIRSVAVIKDLQELMKLKFTGRGGTLIGPVIADINETKPQLSLIFSDGEFRFRDATTKSDIVWVIHNDPDWTAPFGKVLHYTI